MALTQVDHLVYAAPDLETGVARVAETLGVEPAPGGRHPDWGTRNYLVALGARSYLEIIGPDPEGIQPDGPLMFGLHALGEPRLVTWAAQTSELGPLVAEAKQVGVDLGDVLAGSRTRPDGSAVRWHISDPTLLHGDGLVPFFIDWADSEHPATRAPQGGRLVGLRGEHPDPEGVRALLDALYIDLDVQRAEAPALVARVRTRDEREVEIR